MVENRVHPFSGYEHLSNEMSPCKQTQIIHSLHTKKIAVFIQYMQWPKCSPHEKTPFHLLTFFNTSLNLLRSRSDTFLHLFQTFASRFSHRCGKTLPHAFCLYTFRSIMNACVLQLMIVCSFNL